jgi:hypothetical protein
MNFVTLMLNIHSPRFCNCLFWALGQWFKKGGYLVGLRSNKIPFMVHFYWTRNFKILWHYAPKSPYAKRERYVPSLYFRGTVEMKIINNRKNKTNNKE